MGCKGDLVKMNMSDFLTKLKTEIESNFPDCNEVRIQEGTEFKYKARKFRDFAIILSPASDPRPIPRIGNLKRIFFEANVIVLVRKGKREERTVGSGSISKRVGDLVSHLMLNTLSDSLDPSPISQCGNVTYLTTSSDEISAAMFPFRGFVTESID